MVKATVGRFHVPADKDTPLGERKNDTYLCAPGAQPQVDPEGPLARLISALSKIPKQDVPGEYVRYSSTGGPGLAGLHVTAGIDKLVCPIRKVRDVQEWKRRHGSSWFNIPGRVAHELPMHLEVHATEAPRPCNKHLFNWMLVNKTPLAASFVARASVRVVDKDTARKQRGIGPKRAGWVAEYFDQQTTRLKDPAKEDGYVQ